MRFLILIVVSLMACTPSRDAGDHRYLIPWPNPAGEYSLQEVTIHTLETPNVMRGSAALVYAESNFSGGGFSGPFAHPRLTRSGNLYVPRDVESFIAVAAYAHFENIFLFSNRLGFADQITWPRKVGIEMRVNGATGSSQNNAHYFSEADAVVVLPYTLGIDQLPLSLNAGVLAHEHFHAHFQKMVINPLDQKINALYPGAVWAKTVAETEKLDLENPADVNNLILRGWNEGLADFFGVVYTGLPDFLPVSLPRSLGQRSLSFSGVLPRLATGESFKANAKAAANLDDVLETAYQQGTVLARMLYRISKNGSESPEMLLTQVMSRLKDIEPALAKDYTKTILNFDAIVPLLLKDVPLNERICENIQAAVLVATFTGKFSACNL